MIHRYVFHNDRLMPVEDVRLSPGQSGLLSGWGLFTTLRVADGVPFAFERHWHRLAKDATKTHCPFPFEENRVRAQLGDVLLANKVKDGTARIYVIYNQRGFWASEESFPDADLLIYSAGLPAYREPARLGIREQGRHAASPLAGVKVTSWLLNVWNLYEAQQNGYDRLDRRFKHFVSFAKRRAALYADWDEALMASIRCDWAKLGGNGAPVSYLQEGEEI